jgi:ferredoxin-NADP reductase/Na+-transporting NADH:ubiquinone oxidoreductase subunit NqrB
MSASQTATARRPSVDALLGRVSMYRLTTVVLAALVAVYLLLTATGVIAGLSTVGNVAALAVLLVASVASNRLLGLLWRRTPHDESAVITALLLFFLFAPLPEAAAGTGSGIGATNLLWLAGAAVLANVSKYVLAWRGRHVLNPAAAGAFLVVVAQWAVGREAPINALWQTAATQALLPFLAVGVLLVLWRTRRLDVGLVFVVVAYALVLVGLTVGFGTPLADAWWTPLASYPILFMAGFMVTEPLTLPPRRWQQYLVVAVMAVLLGYPTFADVLGTQAPLWGPVSLTPEVAILVGNLVAFALARRTGVLLETAGSRHLGGDTWEVAFRPRRPVRFAPGQHLELHLPHAGVDRRGVRRVFSVSSPPHAEQLSVAVRVPEPASSFKQALVGLREGDRVHATGVHGDFVWPRRSRPLLLVAGGIGVTPFLSQLRAGEGRDVVLVYGVPDGDAVAYRDELVATGVRVVLVSPTRPTDLPDGWAHVAAPVVSGEVVAEAVPDAGDRVAYVSGPPAMVSALRRDLRRRCSRVRTDYFSGY